MTRGPVQIVTAETVNNYLVSVMLFSAGNKSVNDHRGAARNYNYFIYSCFYILF